MRMQAIDVWKAYLQYSEFGTDPYKGIATFFCYEWTDQPLQGTRTTNNLFCVALPLIASDIHILSCFESTEVRFLFLQVVSYHGYN